MDKIVDAVRNIIWRVLGISKTHATLAFGAKYMVESSKVDKGQGSYLNRSRIYVWGKDRVIIGKYCSIADNVNFIVDDGSHTYNNISTYPFDSNSINGQGGIVVGNDVWIGLNATILYGIKIGDGAIIGANAVVTHDVAPYSVVAGIPAKEIKRRCTEEEAFAMQQIAWWNWDFEIIKHRIADFKLPFSEFIAKYQ